MESVDKLTEIIIYTRKEPLCPWCERAKVFLRGKKLSFEERDIYTIYDKEVFVPIAPMTVPQVYINGMLIGGYEALRRYYDT